MNAFKDVQDASHPLVLVNAWDAASARVVEHCGAPAIATSSAALAWSLGYADGEELPLDELLGAIRRITRIVRVPLSVDLESGYGSTVDDLLRTIDAVHAAGAVAVNIEDWNPKSDSLMDPETAYGRIAAVKQRFGDDMYVNARTDVYFRDASDGDVLADTCARLQGFAQAGCDGVFVPGAADEDTIRALVAATDRPLNVLAMPDSPTIAEMRAFGVARISTGVSPAARTLQVTADIARQLLDDGTYDLMKERMPYPDVNALFHDSRS